jgi:hypothetical protein
MIDIFYNLIKVFHDGIIIADKDEIFYHNNQLEEIYGIDLSLVSSAHELVPRLENGEIKF